MPTGLFKNRSGIAWRASDSLAIPSARARIREPITPSCSPNSTAVANASCVPRPRSAARATVGSLIRVTTPAAIMATVTPTAIATASGSLHGAETSRPRTTKINPPAATIGAANCKVANDQATRNRRRTSRTNCSGWIIVQSPLGFEFVVSPRLQEAEKARQGRLCRPTRLALRCAFHR